MKCSTRNTPMGMMPVRECNLRSRNELPSPARSEETPLGILMLPFSIGLADEATTPTPYGSRSDEANLALSISPTTQVKKPSKLLITQGHKHISRLCGIARSCVLRFRTPVQDSGEGRRVRGDERH